MRASTADRRVGGVGGAGGSAGVAEALPAAARSAFARRFTLPTRVLFVVLIVVSLAGAQIPLWLQYLPLAASLVIFGLPHGALDHLVPARLAGTRPSTRSIARVVVLYALLGTATLALWAIAPMLAFGLFILLTWYHWGQGDLFAVLALDGAHHLRSRASKAAALLVRGALPMVVPLVAQGDTYRSVEAGATSVFGATGTPSLIPAVDPAIGTALIVGALVAYALVTGIAARRSRQSRRSWLIDIADVALLAVFFAAVPAVLAIGLYFCLWHALRHIIRLSGIDPASTADLEAGRLGRPLWRFAVDAAPVTLIALVILIGLAVFGPRSTADPEYLLGVYLVLLSALTVPHAVIVTVMDARQRVWVTRQ
ncbi:Brp/Blh family beta-carotene 15,15'-dioxygenase [Marisediminicola senii]|uniref:Brp/Blh family beta-carotene 15,15'-dioxygenase n=1 Tax=Marisediminicola senii TaxID=2711233 RepID=UPI0013EABDCC|nr:Brp/Blh family beta-carotene 15,15'-dioxygenase [Marisediminicola senii]